MSLIETVNLNYDEIYYKALLNITKDKIELKDVQIAINDSKRKINENILQFFAENRYSKSFIFLLKNNINISIDDDDTKNILCSLIKNYDACILKKCISNYKVIDTFVHNKKTIMNVFDIALIHSNLSVLYFLLTKNNFMNQLFSDTSMYNVERLFYLLETKLDAMYTKQIILLLNTLFKNKSISFISTYSNGYNIYYKLVNSYSLLAFEILSLEEFDDDFFDMIISLYENILTPYTWNDYLLSKTNFISERNKILLLLKKKKTYTVSLSNKLMIGLTKFKENRDMLSYSIFLKKCIQILESKHKKEDMKSIIHSMRLNQLCSQKNANECFKYIDSYLDMNDSLFTISDEDDFIPVYDCIRYGSYDTFKYLKKKMGMDIIYEHVLLKLKESYITVKNIELLTIIDLSLLNTDISFFRYLVTNTNIMNKLLKLCNKDKLLHHISNNIMKSNISKKKKITFMKIMLKSLTSYYTKNDVYNTLLECLDGSIFKQLYNYIPCNDINFVLKKNKLIEVDLLKDSFFEQTLYDNLLKQYSNKKTPSVINSIKRFYIQRIGAYPLSSEKSVTLLKILDNAISFKIILDIICFYTYVYDYNFKNNKEKIINDLIYINNECSFDSNIILNEQKYNYNYYLHSDSIMRFNYNKTIFLKDILFSKEYLIRFPDFTKECIINQLFMVGLFQIYITLFRKKIMFYEQYNKTQYIENNSAFKYIRTYLFLNRVACRINNIKKKKHSISFKPSLTCFKTGIDNNKPVHKYISKTVNELIISNNSFMCKQKHPEHVTPKKVLSFIQSNDDIYCTEKADGIKKNIYLNSCFPPYIDFKKYQAEEVIINGTYVYFICADYNTIMELRSKHIYVSDKFTQEYEKETFNTYVNQFSKYKLWWPKMVWKIDLISEYDALKTKKYSIYPTDGWILFKRSGINLECLKIKPKEMLTIDVLYKNNYFYSEENIIDASLITIVNKVSLKNNMIYRCYPIGNNIWEARDERIEKKKPNSLSIIQEIVYYYNLDWSFSDIKPYLVNYYHIDHRIKNMWKTKINTQFLFSIIENYSKQKSILDLGCGYISEKIIKLSKCSEYVGVDIDFNLINKKDSKLNRYYYTLDFSKEWKPQIELFNYDDFTCKTYDIILSLISIHNAYNNIHIMLKNINSVSKKGTLVIIHFLELEKLNSVFTLHSNYISNGSNYVNKIDNNTIKYYYSHCHTTPIVETVFSLEEIEKHFKLYGWSIFLYNSNFNKANKTFPWDMYLNCFSTICFQKN